MRTHTVALLALAFFVSIAKGEFTLTISDDGTNLTMRALGTYDVTAATPVSDPFGTLAVNATVAPTVHSGLYGWNASPGFAYNLTFSGTLTGTGQAVPANSVTTNTPFYLVTSFAGNSYFILSTSALTGTIDETAVFNNVTIASLGMVQGQSVTASWAGDSAKIQVAPEPTTATFLIASACLALSRRRRR